MHVWADLLRNRWGQGAGWGNSNWELIGEIPAERIVWAFFRCDSNYTYDGRPLGHIGPDSDREISWIGILVNGPFSTCLFQLTCRQWLLSLAAS